MTSMEIGPGAVVTLIALGFTAMGLLFVVVGVRTIRQIKHRRRTWIRYPGEAFDYVWRRGNKRSHQHWMLRWIDNGGVERTAENPYGTSGGTFRSFPFPVDVLVNPKNPREAMAAEGTQSGVAVSYLFSVVGGLFAAIGLIMLGFRVWLLFTES